MLEKRLIPVLLLKNRGLVKSIKFTDYKYIGDPLNTVKLFNDKEADELFIIDILASSKNAGPDFELLAQIANEAFMPLGYAGGISNINQMEKIFKLGFEKVGLNSILFENSQIVKDAANAFGSQSVVGIIDIKKPFLGKPKVYQHKNKSFHSLEPVEYARKLQDLGVGEIVLQFVDRDGTGLGYDLEFIKQISKTVSIPIVALGGASSLEDFKAASHSGADAVAAGSFFIFHGPHKAVLINYPKRSVIDTILGNPNV